MKFIRQRGIFASLVGVTVTNEWHATLIRRGSDEMSSLHLHWVNPINGNRCGFVWAWPRRDNLWSRWRYESFSKTGQYVAWKQSRQVVFW